MATARTRLGRDQTRTPVRHQAPRALPPRHPMLALQRSAGNRALSTTVQRDYTPPPAPAVAPPQSSTPPPIAPPVPATPKRVFADVEEATNVLLDAVTTGKGPEATEAREWAFHQLNGMNPEGMVAALQGVTRKDLLYKFAPGQDYIDIPRVSTGIAGTMSGKPDDTVTALYLLDAFRNTKGSEAFWTDNVGVLSPTQLRNVLLVADRSVLTAMRDALDTAPPSVHQVVGPVLGKLFDPPASQIELEFIPDQFDMPATITLPNGTTADGLAPVGTLTAKVSGRVAASVTAQGGMWASQDAGGGHHADPTKPGKHILGAAEKVRTSFWKASQLAQGTPLREVTKKGALAVEYLGEDKRWHDTRNLPKPFTREEILALVKDLRSQLEGPDDKKAQDLVPDGVIPPTWIFNDFGDHAYRILGTDELVHTSANQEVEHNAGIHEQIGWSHGCLHLRPSGRDQLEQMHLLKGGVTLNVHAYVKGVAEYGKAPGFN